MRGQQIAGGKSHDGNENGKKVKSKQLQRQLALGDLIWVKLYGDSWWPAQVVDENTVSESSKPSYRPAQAVLVRVYGSYKYLYMDPVECQSEFERVLKQNNGSHHEIFEKALEQELLQLKSSRPNRKASASTDYILKKPKSNRPNTKEGVKCKNSMQRRVHKIVEPNSSGTKEEERSKTFRQDEIQKIVKPNSCTCEEDKMERTPEKNEGTNLSRKASDLSGRRLRVMQSLGLIAPAGSPYKVDKFT